MTPQLRVIHRRTWTALAIVLPVFAILAILSAPVAQKQKGSIFSTELLYPEIIATSKRGDFTAHLRENAAHSQQLELIVPEMPAHAESLIYFECTGHEKVFAGKLRHAGSSVYPLDSSKQWEDCTVTLFDPFQQTSFLTFSF